MKDYITYLKFDDISEKQLVLYIESSIKAKEKAVVCTPNLDILRVAYKNLTLRNFINKSKYVTIDGKPVLWLARLQKKKNFKYKISGSDLTPSVLKVADNKKYSVLIFGGKEGVAERAKKQIQNEYPNIKKIVAICPTFDYDKDINKSMEYIKQINDEECDIVLMCTGSPKTELFINEYFEYLNNSVYMIVGATVDFLAGNIKRAPKWVSNIGMEWLYRLSKDFKRLYKRYALDFLFLIKIIFLLLFNKNKIQEVMRT